jgi:hypothetical protein
VLQVRSRTFSGPYIGSTLADRGRLAGLVGVLAGANLALGLSDPGRTATAALAVLAFNILYEALLSRSLRQYTMTPLMDFLNHSAAAGSDAEVSLDYFTDRYSVQAGRPFAAGEQASGAVRCMYGHSWASGGEEWPRNRGRSQGN